MEAPQRPSSESQRCELIRVCLKGPTESRAVTVRRDCTVRQLKAGLAERMGVWTEEGLVLIHCGRVLKDLEILRSLQGKDGAVELCVVQRAAHTSSVSTDEDSESVPSPLPADLDLEAQTPTSPLFLVEGLDSLGLTSSGQGFFPSLQRQMETQLLADQEMMRRVLAAPFVQSTFSSASVQLTRQLIQSNPQTQQLLQTNPELKDVLYNSDVITQVLELVRNPEMINEVLKSEDKVQQESPESITCHFSFPQSTANSKQENASQDPCTDPLRKLTASPKPELNPESTVTTGLQSLLEQITSSPGFIESLLSGPYVGSLLKCLSQNPELAAQMLLSYPLFSENPQLQQQMRQQLPLLLQQMQSPELLSAMLNPKAVEALLQIQQGLQTLATEAPALIPAAGFGNTGVNLNAASDTVLNNKTRSGPGVATATEQQQHFVKQMLQALANTDHEDVEQLNPVVFGDT